MAEKTFEEERNNGWTYVGKNSKGESKFRKYTNETLEYVKDFLDKKEIAYFVREQQALIFIYKEKDPASMYSSRYAYYYTTGRWGSDKRRKHYHSDGIEHFMSTYYTTVEQDKKYWDDLKDQKDKDE